MDEHVSTFISAQHGWDSGVLIFAALSAISLVILITYLIKSEKSFAELIKSSYSLLLFTSVILTAGIAINTWKNTNQLDIVIINSNNIATPFGTCKLTNIKEVTFVTVPQKNKSSNIQSDSIHFLLIEEYTGKAHPLSEENYDIQAIFTVIQKQLETVEKNKLSAF